MKKERASVVSVEDDTTTMTTPTIHGLLLMQCREELYSCKPEPHNKVEC